MLTIILASAATLLLGLFAGWYFSKSNAAAQIAILGNSLAIEKERYAKAVQDCEEAGRQKDMHSTARAKADRDCEGWIKKHEGAEAQLSAVKEDVQILRREKEALQQEVTGLRAKDESLQERIAAQQSFIEEANSKLREAFSALSAAALKSNNESFVELAKAKLEEKVTDAKGDFDKKQQAIDALVKPLDESLRKMDEKINALETKREGAYGNITALLSHMQRSTENLDQETRHLVSALKTSHTRGRWGEIALRRLVEFAGMTDHCDFSEQLSTDAGEGAKLRPDMIVRLPESRQIVVDSKVPLAAYLEMFETEDSVLQRQHLERHKVAVRTHIKDLSGKAYWDQFPEAPDFVVLFMQIESSFGAALQAWPGMIEEAINNRIIIATPTTLITILKSVAYSWQQRSTMANIDAIRDAAVELYERSCTLMAHLDTLGGSLKSAVTNFNKTVGSLERNFMPQGRRIADMAGGYTKTKELPEVAQIEVAPRELSVIPVRAVGPIAELYQPGF